MAHSTLQWKTEVPHPHISQVTRRDGAQLATTEDRSSASPHKSSYNATSQPTTQVATQGKVPTTGPPSSVKPEEVQDEAYKNREENLKIGLVL